MAKPILQIGKGSILNINWELVSHCQLNCTYCYYKPFRSQTDYSSLYSIVLKKLKEITEPFKINLVGGEPTLHPNFFEVIHELYEIPQLQSIALVTNLEQDLDFYSNLKKYHEKLRIVASYHPEYPQKDFFIKTADLQDRLLIDIVFIVHNNSKLLKKMQEDSKKMYELLNDKAIINFIRIHEKRTGKEEYRKYDDAVEVFFQEQLEIIKKRTNTEVVELMTEDGWEQITKLEFMRDKRNQWEGWFCNLHAFIIHEDGYVTRSCSRDKKHILLTKFEKRPLVCTYKICECDDYWSFEKTPKGNG